MAIMAEYDCGSEELLDVHNLEVDGGAGPQTRGAMQYSPPSGQYIWFYK